MHWYYAENGTQQGPVEFEKLVALVAEGRLKPSDLVWNSSMGKQWAKAGTVEGLFEQAPPELSVEPAPNSEWSEEATYKSAVSNKDLMAQARTALDGNWGKAIGGLLIYLLVLIVLGVIPVLGSVVSFVIGGPLMVGWALFFLNLARQQPSDVGQIFAGFKQFANGFIAYLLMMLLILAWSLPALAVGGVATIFFVKGALAQGTPDFGAMLWLMPLMLLAIIPAVIAQFRYSQTYYILNDFPGVGPMESIRRSKQMMVGNKWKLFCLQCRFIGWAFLCMLTFGIGFLWLVPYMMVSISSFYDDVKKGA